MLAPALGERARVDRVEADLVDQLRDGSLRLLVVARDRDTEPLGIPGGTAVVAQAHPLDRVEGLDHTSIPQVCLQRGFSRASRRIRWPTSSETGARPSRLCGYVQRLATSRRCQRSTVSGLTNSELQLARGSSRLAAASSARSACRSRGRPTCRRRTSSSWRSTMISNSLNSVERKQSATNSSTRRSARYKNAISRDQPSRRTKNRRL